MSPIFLSYVKVPILVDQPRAPDGINFMPDVLPEDAAHYGQAIDLGEDVWAVANPRPHVGFSPDRDQQNSHFMLTLHNPEKPLGFYNISTMPEEMLSKFVRLVLLSLSQARRIYPYQ